MEKATISLTIECAPEMTAQLPPAAALSELLLNGRVNARELPSALLAALLETSRLIETGTLSPADHPRVWDLVETACEVVAEQVQSVLARQQPLLGANGNGKKELQLEFQEAGQW